MDYSDARIPGTVLLAGITGSQAYGMAHPGSDTDRLGVFALPSLRWLDMNPPSSRDFTVVFSHPDPDTTLHEAYKFMRLCLNGNPTATELLWLPQHCYEVRHPLGEALLAIRAAFACAQRVREAYCGYAQRQLAELLEDATGPRVEKHARHLLRLHDQGLGFYTSGRLEVVVDDPDRYRAFGQAVAAGDTQLAAAVLDDLRQRMATARPALPEHPDEVTVARWYAQTRQAFLAAPAS